MRVQANKKSNIQLIWGIALILVGLAVFFRIPQVMPELAKIQQFAGTVGFIRICLYLMGIILIGGGIKKLVCYYQLSQKSTETHSGNHASEKESTR